MKKVYLDTCVLSNLLQNEIDDDQLDALDYIVDDKELELVTSNKTLDEFLNTPDDRRRKSLKVLFKIIGKVYAPPHKRHYSGLVGDAPFGVVPMGGGSVTVVDGLSSGLCKIFDENDAEHIYISKKSGCDYFLTLDRRTILNRVARNQDKMDLMIGPMRVCDPVMLREYLRVEI